MQCLSTQRSALVQKVQGGTLALAAARGGVGHMRITLFPLFSHPPRTCQVSWRKPHVNATLSSATISISITISALSVWSEQEVRSREWSGEVCFAQAQILVDGCRLVQGGLRGQTNWKSVSIACGRSRRQKGRIWKGRRERKKS